MKPRTPEQKLFDTFASGVAYVSVIKKDGDPAIGTAFHIGDGVFITARHVVEGLTIKEIATTNTSIRESTPGKYYGTWSAKAGNVVGGPFYHSSEKFDVAALRVEGIYAPVIPLHTRLDDKFGNELILENVVVMGYPPIPLSPKPCLVATRAEVDASFHNYTGSGLHYILSAMARGGFSGGVAITHDRLALGVICQSLTTPEKPPELGYLAVLGVRPIYELLDQHKIMPGNLREFWSGRPGRKPGRVRVRAGSA